MKKYLPLLLLLLSPFAKADYCNGVPNGQSVTDVQVTHCVKLPGTFTFASLPLFTSVSIGTTAYTSDDGEVISTVTGWSAVGGASSVTPTSTTTFSNKTISCTTNTIVNVICEVAASGDTSGVTDLASINAVLTAGATPSLQNAHYYFDAGFTIDVGKQGFYGNGAHIDFGPAGSATYITVTATVGGVSHDAEHERFPIKDFWLSCPSEGTGLYLNSAAEPAVAFIGIYNVAVEYCTTNILLGNQVYVAAFHDVVSNLAIGTAFSVPAGLTNTGENILFDGGAITNSPIGVSCQLGGAEIRFHSTSIDDDTTYLNIGGSCIIDLDHVHFEIGNGNTLSTAPIVMASGYLLIDGGLLIADGSAGSQTYPEVIFMTSGSTVAITGGAFLNNLQSNSAGGTLTNGNGTLLVAPGTSTFLASALPTVSGPVSSNMNLMADGGFEDASIVDNVSINADTAAITSRLTGTNISLAVSSAAHHSGSQSLAAVKVGAATTAAGFVIIVPVTPAQLLGSTFWISANASYSQTLSSGGYWGNCVYGLGGAPMILNSSSVGAQLITNLSTTWQEIYVPRVRAPPWANCFYLNFGETALPASTLYVDDVNLSAL